MFYYNFIIFVKIVLAASPIHFAKCKELSSYPQLRSLTPFAELSSLFEANGADIYTNTPKAVVGDYSFGFVIDKNNRNSDMDDIAVNEEGAITGSMVQAAPASVIDDDVKHLAAHGFRTKQKSQHLLPKILQNDANTLESLNLIAGVREDICKAHCSCARERNAFTHVTCDFEQNRKLNHIFGNNFQVPRDATSITIKLTRNTKFRLQRGFFNNNTVNSLTISGTNKESEQVEIQSEAFHDNKGPYPDIQIVDVFSVIVRTKAFAGNVKFTVRNSNDLIIYPDAFEKAGVNGLFDGINDLRIEEKAFNSAQARLRINSSHIDNIYRFDASLREIRFTNCSIGNINGGTFDVININSIVFESCRIDSIKARAITEKLFSKHFNITGAIIGSIESEAIYGSGISELILTNNKIDTIQENAIYVTAINATIAKNDIKYLKNNWLRVKDWSNIVVENNRFGVFGRMSLEETMQPVICRFDGNSLTQPLPESLNITNHYCRIREISVDMLCRCTIEKWLQTLSSHDLRSEIYCRIDDKLSACFNATSFNTLKYLNEVCDEQKTTLDCGKNMNLKKVEGNFYTAEELEQNKKFSLWNVLLLLSVILVALLIVVMTIWCCFRCRRNKKNQESDHSSIISKTEHLHEFTPEQRYIINDTVKVMQRKYPGMHKKIEKSIKKLLERNLTHNECGAVIAKIVHILSNDKNAENEFQCFNLLLKQHLQPKTPTAPLAVPDYSVDVPEDGGFYTSTSIVPTSIESNGGVGGQCFIRMQQQLEPVYAEPSWSEQPLLRNEYALPADRSTEQVGLYAEPINERDPPVAYAVSAPMRENQISTPPQYATPKRSQNQRLPQIPSTADSRFFQLPDVIFRRNPEGQLDSNILPTSQAINNNKNKPPAHVHKLVQDSQNVSNFPLPSSSLSSHARQRPLITTAPPPIYTAPLVTQKTRAPRAMTEIEEGDFNAFDMRGAAALPPDSNSNHSGGSGETVAADDVIEYADA